MVSHLLFTDDSFFISEVNQLLRILRTYEVVSG